MLATISAVMVRYRRPILTVALVLAVVLAVVRQLSPTLGLILAIATSLTGVLVLLLALALLALRRPRPAAFLVKPEVRAFATEPSAVQIYLAVGLTFVASSQLLTIGTFHRVSVGLVLVLQFLLLVAIGIQLAASWRGSSIELRPDGVYQRDFVGSLMVPWEALAPGRPSRPAVRASTLALTYAQPDLVRRRGILPLGWRRLRTDNIHPWFIADTIRHYVDHPQHRAAIGEPAEYQRLWHALTSAPTGSGHGHAS
ncbi:hypothetical protein [Micromonospora inositola]|uniref:PH domain-containing protein n=1 Tax=Micromonospora inositola TaxID=47865 RepID=A0A1C5HCB3_9ACTN|nr:hypothetical protein [Micromonospora inositola]SCG43659.1 hypothetical protein GA0070613_1120 [Micromonospora inositola]